MDRTTPGRFRLRNRLRAAIDDERLRDLVTFAAGPVALGPDVLVELGLTRGLDGHAAGLFRSPPYGWDSDGHPEVRYFLRAAFPGLTPLLEGSHWPCESSRTPSGPGRNHLKQIDAYGPIGTVRLVGLEEEIVYLLGHESWHLEQHRRDEASGWQLYAHPDGSTDHDRLEREAELVGRDRLAAFRRLHSKRPRPVTTPPARRDPGTLGAAMRAVALRPEHFDELGDFGWLDGGCAIYAEAVRRYLGEEATLAYVVAEGDGYGPIVDHALIIAFGYAFDGDGATPLNGYLARYARLEGRADVTLELLHAEELAGDRDLGRQARELPVNQDLARRLARAWRAELG
jgi:hypothetical protein